LVGKSTRLAPFLAAADKTYLATIHLGLVTKTLDVTGEAVGPQYQGPYPSRVEVEKALTNLTGTMAQMPPAFSAIKVNGQTAHKAARAGKEIDLKPREVTAHALELIDYDPPFATLRAEVSKGYYVRSLARDLGLALNLIGGALAKLRRLSVGSFTLKEAGPIPETFLELKNRLISPREAVNHLPELFPSANELIALTRGQTIPWPATGLASEPWGGPASGATSGAAKAAGVHKIISPDGQLAALGEIFEKTPGLEPSARSPEGPFLRPLRVFAKAQEAKTNL
jgi:tRNA pseudouridine55 synthase